MSSSKETKKTPQKKRLHALFKGRVQGVGFRYTAEAIAHEAGVTGWVRNLPDGDVEILAEGTEQALSAMLEKIQSSQLGRHIRKTETEWQEYRNEFTEFRVEFVY